MPSKYDILTFLNDGPPPGASPWVVEPQAVPIDVIDPDPRWPAAFDGLAERVRSALGARVLDITHIGSTAVPGLPAKPIIDIDLILADPAEEDVWVPPLERAGFVLTVREPWWHEHRVMKAADPAANLHVFSPDAPEPWKHRIFRDHLRRDAQDRELYARAKRDAAVASSEAGETVMAYNARKEKAVREIYARAFRAAGLSEHE
ncbi:GrpB family protein [Microbacterium karelineae]|uniref:GrpB family protein n=1 Tax=Microbacterium karelineae TaxID=2654283 RepID=UPI0012E9E5A9|nr:GrpB family protein [Microbacterium karelineae]